MALLKLKKISIDLSLFQISLIFEEPAKPFVVHFDSPNRKFYCALIGLIVFEMKKKAKPGYININSKERLKQLEILDKVLLGKKASKDNKHRKDKCRTAWHRRLRDAERAESFKIINREIKKIPYEKFRYILKDDEGEIWCDLFQYDDEKGSWKFKFAFDQFGLEKDDVEVVYHNDEGIKAWETFYDSLKAKLRKRSTENSQTTDFSDENATVIKFLNFIKNRYIYIKFFISDQEISLEDQYIPVRVTYKDEIKNKVESTLSYFELKDDLRRVYSSKGIHEFGPFPIAKSWSLIKKENSSIMVLAEAGMGKTTLLKMEAWQTAEGERKKLLDKACKIDDLIIPIFMKLSELADRNSEIIDSIPKLIRRKIPETLKGVEILLRKKIKKGQCLLLLDALDEVPLEDRNELSEKIDRFVFKYKCSIICTSRIASYDGLFLKGCQNVEILPFRPKDVKNYVKKWFKNTKYKTYRRHSSEEAFFHEMQNQASLEGIAKIPMILSLLCELCVENKIKYPIKRKQIYKDAVNHVLGRYTEQRKPKTKWKRFPKTILLEKLAYYISHEGRQKLPERELYEWIDEYLKSNDVSSDFKRLGASELLGELTEEDGILIKFDNSDNFDQDEYIFFHRTFQEYFTASYLNRIINKNKNEGFDLLNKYIPNFDWHETITLLAGMCNDPTSLIQLIYKKKDDIFNTFLMLAGRCIAECNKISNELVFEIFEKIYKIWVLYPNENYLRSTVLVLAKANSILLKILIKHLKNEKQPLKESILTLLEVIGNPEVIPALIEAISEDNRENPIAAIRNLGDYCSPRAIPALIEALSNDNQKVILKALNSLGYIVSPAVVPVLVQAIKDMNPEIKKHALLVLSRIDSPEVIPALANFFSDKDPEIRRCATWYLGSIKNSKIIPVLIEALSDEDREVRRIAANALSWISDSEVIPALIEALCSEESDVREMATNRLVDIDSNGALSAFIETLQDNKPKVRMSATIGLGYIGRPEAIPALIGALHDEDQIVRISSLNALVKIGDPGPLIKALKHEDQEIKLSAIIALGKYKSSEVISALIEASSDKDIVVKSFVLHALYKTGFITAYPVLREKLLIKKLKEKIFPFSASEKNDSSQILPALIESLNDEDSEIRLFAARALRKYSGPEVIALLVEALKDKEQQVRNMAALSLGNIGSPEVIPALIEVLSGTDIELRNVAIQALSNMGKLDILKKIVESPEIDIYDPEIFSLARTLAIRFCKENVSFIPVYPEIVEKFKKIDNL